MARHSSESVRVREEKMSFFEQGRGAEKNQSQQGADANADSRVPR